MQHFEFPRQSLGFFPTPLHELKNLSAALCGPQLFVKRDDLTGLALGGNKTRKLEYLVGAAVVKGADTLITAGAIQSNHCRQTAAAAARMGMACHLVLGGSAPSAANGNLLLDGLLGATIHWAGEHRKGEDIPRIAEELRAAGRRPFIVPYGGSNEIGALGFVEGLRELQEQAAAMNLEFDHIIFASSSGGTHAGLMIGRELLKMPCRLTGIAIDKVGSADKSFRQQIIELANAAGQMLGLDHHFSAADLHLNEDFTGAGYAVIGETEREAISLCARHEGILVDPVYTGRALAGMIGLIRNGTFKKHEKVLFWHTGGSPALFAYSDALQTK
ncbi:MAG TPA: D-cysteine desulfhydrase family protein [Candidatus Rifleibacterium sp.]|nr:D-cysteine desulfhydrase family protein [Candidatus Rifleibacterium sp.]